MTEQRQLIPHLRKGIYLHIKSAVTGLALSMPPSNKYTKDKLEFQHPDPNNSNQLWMIEEITPNRYEIVHAVSTLVLECLPGTTKCKLEFGKQRPSQIFTLELDPGAEGAKDSFINRSELEGYQPPDDYDQDRLPANGKKKKAVTFKANQRFTMRIRIAEKPNSSKYLHCVQTARATSSIVAQQEMQPFNSTLANRDPLTKLLSVRLSEYDSIVDKQSCCWQICEIYPQENQLMSQTCYICSLRSGYALDVPEANDKPGSKIIQYPCNFRFNQKWIFRKVDEVNGYSYYMIENAKSGLLLDIRGESTKEGTPVIQWHNHEGKNQIWRLEQQGKRTYLLRSALDKDLLLGIEDNSLKECAELVTSKIEADCFWVIYGHIPQ